MSLFVPPKPAPLPEKPGLLKRARLIARSSLAVLQSGSYAAPGVGRMAVPSVRGRRRWVYQVRDPACARDILVNRAGDFPKGELMGWMLRPLTGDSIFTTNGEVWRRQRRLVDPALEQARVRESFARMREAAETALQGLERSAGRGGAVRVDDAMTVFAADVIFRTIFSEPIAEAEAREAIAAFEAFQDLAYAHGMIGLSGLPGWLMPGTWARMRAGKRLRRVLKRPLDRRLARVAAGEPDLPTDILASLMASRDPETETGFSPDELLDQVSMLFLAGHETSASGLAWALYLLAEAPDVQSRARAEVKAVVGDGPIAFEHMKRLGLVRDVFREALRLYPPVTTVVRECARPEPMGRHQAQPGDPLFVAPWILHRLSSVWPNPDAFDPDRFDTPEGREAVRQAYLPFSLGPRVCPGAAFALQEATLMLALILGRFELTRDEAWPPPEPVAKLTLRSANGVTVRLTPVSS